VLEFTEVHRFPAGLELGRTDYIEVIGIQEIVRRHLFLPRTTIAVCLAATAALA
jgi:hypothetical protein